MWRGDLQSLMQTSLLLYAYSGKDARAVTYYYFFRRRRILNAEEMEELLEGWSLLCKDEGTCPDPLTMPYRGVHFEAFKWASLYRLSQWVTECNRKGVAPPARYVVSQYIHYWFRVQPRLGEAQKHLEGLHTSHGFKNFLRTFRDTFTKKSAVMPLSHPMLPEAISTKAPVGQKTLHLVILC